MARSSLQAASASSTGTPSWSSCAVENNEHRSGINRSGAQIASDMPRLRRAPALLVDEQVPPRQRLDQLYPRGGPATVGYLGPAILTPILQVAYPDEYGVRNGITEAGMRQVGAWPLPPTSASFAEQYESINGILLRLAAELEIDLWTLDSLWWKRTSRRAKGPATGSGIAAAAHEGPPRRSRGPRGPSSHGWSCCRAGSGSRWKLPGTGCCGSSARSTPTTMASPTPNPTESSRSTCWPRSR